MKTLAALGLALTLALTTTAHANAQNLLTNPGFETGDYSGWNAFGSGPNITQAGDLDDIVRTGTFSSKIFGEFTNCPFGSFTVGGYNQVFTPTAGKWYEFSGFSYVSSENTLQGTTPCDGARALAKIVYFNAAVGGAELGAVEIPIGEPNSIVDQWNEFSIVAPVPAGAVRVEALILFLQPVCEEGAVFVDDLSFSAIDAPAAPANLLVNGTFNQDGSGNIANWTGFGNVFYEPVANLAFSPVGAAKMFGTFTENSPSVLTQSIASVTPGKTYEFSARVNNLCIDAIQGGNGNFLLGRVEFYNASNDTTAAEGLFFDASELPGAWPKKSLQAVAPADAVSAAVFFLFIQPNVLEGGSVYIDNAVFAEAQATSAPSAPRSIQLAQNQPNPFNPSTMIAFSIDRAGVVELDVFDAAGRKVTSLLSREMTAGTHSVQWNGLSDDGAAVASGVYHYVLRTADEWTSRSMVLLK